MKALVIYESLTGTTKLAAEKIAQKLEKHSYEATACPVNAIDLQQLSNADLVIIGSWTDGLIFAGQKPGRANRLKNIPRIDGKHVVVFCTYAIDPGKTLTKMQTIAENLGGDVIGGFAIKRSDIDEQVSQLVQRLDQLTIAA